MLTRLLRRFATTCPPAARQLGLPKPDRTWRWNLAPIPEWSPDFHRVHEVGAWIIAPSAER